MGTWGAGNFDGDEPRDFLADVILRWEQLIDKLLAGEALGGEEAFGHLRGLELCEACLMPTVEVLVAAAEKLECDYLPDPEKVRRWSEKYLDLYDREIGARDPPPGHKEERRKVIADTFGHLLRIVGRQSSG